MNNSELKIMDTVTAFVPIFKFVRANVSVQFNVL